jgi:hypothetical protein
MCTVGCCPESQRTGPRMASPPAFRTGERARKCGRSRSCSAYNTGCLSLASPVYGLPPTNPPPRSQSIAPCCSPAGNLATTVAAGRAIHVSRRSYAQLHARLWRARSPGRQLLSSKCSLSNVTIIYANDRCFRGIELSRFYASSDSGKCADRYRSDV